MNGRLLGHDLPEHWALTWGSLPTARSRCSTRRSSIRPGPSTTFRSWSKGRLAVRRAIVPAAAILVVGLIVVEVLSGSSSDKAKPAPPLPSAVLQPPKTTLASLQGRPAIVNFWASWCGPCRKEAPELERFDRSIHGSAQLVGVDYTDQGDAARSFIQQYGWTFPVLSDPDGIYGARYGINGLPTTVVLNSQGRIIQVLSGPQSAADLRQALQAVAGN